MLIAQVARFGAVGVAQNAVNVATFAGVHAAGVDYRVAAVVAALVALVVSFELHRRWTFVRAARRGRAGEAVRYCVVFATAVAAGVALLTFQVEALHVTPVAGQTVAILLVAPVSYLAQRHWVFR